MCDLENCKEFCTVKKYVQYGIGILWLMAKFCIGWMATGILHGLSIIKNCKICPPCDLIFIPVACVCFPTYQANEALIKRGIKSSAGALRQVTSCVPHFTMAHNAPLTHHNEEQTQHVTHTHTSHHSSHCFINSHLIYVFNFHFLAASHGHTRTHKHQIPMCLQACSKSRSRQFLSFLVLR